MTALRTFGAGFAMLFTLSAASEPPPRDVFTGTLSIEQGRPVLTRCDAAGNRYRLIDRRTGVARTLLDEARSGDNVFDIIGSADEVGGQNTLTVDGIDKRVPRPICHLAEIDAMFGPAPAEKMIAGEQFDLSALLECRSDHATADRFGQLLDSDARLLAAASLARVPSRDFVAEYRSATPFRVFGHMTTRLGRHNDGFLAVLDDITPEALAQKIGAKIMLHSAPFIAQKVVETPPPQVSGREHVPIARVQTVTSRDGLPGKAVTGCLYFSAANDRL